MATAFNRVERQVPLKNLKIATFTNPIICNLDFEGIVPLHISGKLASELLKYILYNRGQIPMQYDTLLKNVLQEKNFKEAETRSSVIGRQRRLKKVQETIHSVEEILNKLSSIFAKSDMNNSAIKEILVILGATPVSPKNTFKIQLPSMLYATNNGKQTVSLRQCLVHVFRKMVMMEDLCNLPDLCLTNTFIFVKMPRHHINDWFLPKPEYCPSSRGKWIHFVMKNNTTPGNCINYSELFSANLQKLVVKKPEVLKATGTKSKGFTIYSDSPHLKKLPPQTASPAIDLQDQPADCSSGLMKSQIPELTKSVSNLMINEQSFLTNQFQDEYIWYQAPVVIKGFKDWITSYQNLNEIWA